MFNTINGEDHRVAATIEFKKEKLLSVERDDQNDYNNNSYLHSVENQQILTSLDDRQDDNDDSLSRSKLRQVEIDS